jgi:Ni/Co efflux regulator RcnB
MKKLLVFLIAAFMLTATYAEPKKKPTNITEKVAADKKGKAKDKKEAKKPKKRDVKVKRPEELKKEKEASKK